MPLGAQLFRTDLFGGFAVLEGREFATRLEPHVHANYVLGVIDAGAVRVTVGEQSWLATPGSVLLLRPFEVHTELAEGPCGWSFRYVYPNENVVRAALGLAPDDGPGVLAFRAPVVDDEDLAASLGNLFTRLASGGSLQASRQAMAGICELARHRHGRGASTDARGYRGRLAAARTAIAHGTSRMTLRDMADVAGLSPFYFNRTFRQVYGLPPYAYYEQVRIARAHDLILRGHTLTDVAFRLGYSDQAHFTRHFRRGSFTTPGRFAAMGRGAFRPHRAE